MLWLNFLHFYQPANAGFTHLKKALDKSYWRLVMLLEEHPNLRFTVNVSGCLLARLKEENETAFGERLKRLAARGQVELTGSAAYHGLLPLLPAAEVSRQVKENEKILTDVFGRHFRRRGFFLPEMAYTPAVAKIVKDLGYRWLIVDEIAFAGGRGPRPNFSRLYTDAASGLKIVFRNRELSAAYPPDKLWPLFQDLGAREKGALSGASRAGAAAPAAGTKRSEAESGPFLTATDAELYGLRHEDPTAALEKIVKIKALATATLSDFLARGAVRPALTVELTPSSWESTPAEVKSGRPFRLWEDKSNAIQVYLWRLARLALAMGEKFKKDKNYSWHRWHLVRGLASCTFWWASGRDFSKVYGPYAWSPDDIERGLEDLIRSVRSFSGRNSRRDKLAAENYYWRLKRLIWQAHWRRHWLKNYE